MAVTESGVRGSRPLFRHRETTSFVLFTQFLMLPVVGFIGWGTYHNRFDLHTHLGSLAIWTMAFALLNVLDLSAWNGRVLTPDVPVLVAIGLTFAPATAGLIGFVGSIDRREFVGTVTPTRALFNRTQGAILAMLPSFAARMIPHSVPDPWRLSASTLAALVVLTFANYGLVSIAGKIADKTPLLVSLRNLVMGRLSDFAMTWIGWGLMGMLLVAAESSIGSLAIVIFTVPALFGRQVLARSSSTITAETRLEGKKRVITELSSRIFDERRDERERIASDLHDEVLQPLYQVSLMCEVVKQDTANGQLLELDKDMPLLNLTVELASKNLRNVIGRLRNSPVGLRGMASTLRGLLSDLSAQSRVEIGETIEDIPFVNPSLQLIIYQVAKEAVTNAVKHGHASRIAVHLARDADAIRLSVEDDGTGFDPRVAQLDHFGLLIMRERTESVGGILLVDSRLGEGTIVAARFPTEV